MPFSSYMALQRELFRDLSGSNNLEGGKDASVD